VNNLIHLLEVEKDKELQLTAIRVIDCLVEDHHDRVSICVLSNIISTHDLVCVIFCFSHLLNFSNSDVGSNCKRLKLKKIKLTT
jgi:hypothetical protein